MQKVSEYKMIADDSTRDFNTQVNEALKSGWTLHGTTFSIGDFLYQAVIKVEDKSIGPDITFV